MGLVAAAVLAQGDMLKSLAMVVLGLLLGIVGSDVDSGVKRFYLGFYELADGIGFLIIAVGVFAVGEIISNLSEPEDRVIFTSKVGLLWMKSRPSSPGRNPRSNVHRVMFKQPINDKGVMPWILDYQKSW